jgi:hypothetical protein
VHRFFWHGLLCVCLLGLGPSSPAKASEVVFSAQSAESDPQLQQIELKGQARLFAGNYRILADYLLWDQATQTVSARGNIEIAGPEWVLSAQSLRLDLHSEALSAQAGSLEYFGLKLDFARAELNQANWQFKVVNLSAAGIPGIVQADSLLLYPTLSSDNLQLSNARWSVLPLPIPSLNFSLPLGEAPPQSNEVRTQTGWFSPSLNLVQGGLALGSTSRLYQDSQQRLYGRLDYNPLQGVLAGFSHEWRPQNTNGVLNTEILGMSPTLNANAQPSTELLRGHLEWQGDLGGKNQLKTALHWQEPSLFLNRLLLPPIKNNLQALAWHSDSLLLSDWLHLPGLRLRGLAGVQFSDQNWLGAGSLQAISSAWIPVPGLGFQASGMFNGLFGSSLQASTGGLRLLSEWQASENWILGGYGEQYLSSLPSGFFAQDSWLQARGGLYTIWKITPDWAWGGRVEWVLPAQAFSALETMISLRQGIWVLNLLAQAIPAGLQVQLQTSLF